MLGPLFATECAYVCGKIFFPREILRKKKWGNMCCAPFATAATEDSYVCGKKVDCRIHVYVHTDRQTVRHTDIRIGSATRDLCCVLVHAGRWGNVRYL